MKYLTLAFVLLLAGCTTKPIAEDHTSAMSPVCYESSDVAYLVRAMLYQEETAARRKFAGLYYSERCGILAQDSQVKVLSVQKVVDDDTAPAVARIVSGGTVWYTPTNYLNAYWSCVDRGSDSSIAACLRQHYRY